MPKRPTPAWWREHAERLDLRREGGELVGPCPNCKKGDNRFAVRLSDGLIHCRICKSFKRILRAAGWEYSASKPSLDLKVTRSKRHEERHREPNGKTVAKPIFEAKNKPNGGSNDLKVRQWKYMTKSGAMISVRRTDRPGHPKSIERSPPGIKGPYLPLIRQPYDGYEGPTVIVEGEVAADAVLESGYAACCWINGSNAVSQTDWNGIREMEIVLWPDADIPGNEAMQELAKKLRKQDCSIRMVDVSELPERADAVDVEKALRPEMIEDALPWREPPPRGATDLASFEFVTGIEPPEQLLPRYIERGSVSVLAGRGGTAKTSRAVVETLALISGQENIVDVTAPKQYKVAHLVLEGGGKIFQGRMVEAALYYGISPELVEERLFMWKEGWRAKLGGEQGWSLIEWMAGQLRNARIDVLMADPMSFLCETDSFGNVDNPVVVMEQLIELALLSDVGIRLIHHANKGSADKAHVDNVRGAGAITDHARVVDVMTVERAEFENRNTYTLGEASKRNNMEDPERTSWQVVERNKFPIMVRKTEKLSPMAMITPEEKQRALSHLLGCPPGNRRADERSIGWSGQAVSDCFRESWGKPGVGSTNAKERSREQSECRAKARELLRIWLREGILSQAMETISGRKCSVHVKSDRY